MQSEYRILLAPNGNGALFDSIAKSEDLRSFISKLECVQVIGVDNTLNKVLDPIQIGFNVVRKLQASLKCCPKVNAKEKVGVVATKDGKAQIIEYSEIPIEQMEATNPDGSLQFRHGSILMFMLDAKFLLSLIQKGNANISLYHKAWKKVEYCDLDRMEIIQPEKENAWKFELFIQNFLPCVESGRLGVMEVCRETEFAPIKNADGPAGQPIVSDSPSSSL